MVRFLAALLLTGLLAFSIHSAHAEEATAPANGKIVTAAIAPTATALTGKPKQANDFVQKLGDDAVSILADKSVSEDAKNQRFRDMLNSSFDLQTIGRFVVGRTWYSANPDQQKEYIRLFEKLVVQIYSERFALYKGEKFTAIDARQEGERDYIVNGEIAQPNGGQPIAVDWRVRDFGKKMAIIDVVVEGVSMSVTQRQEYMAVIQRNGGDIQPLLDMMRDRLEKPKAG